MFRKITTLLALVMLTGCETFVANPKTHTTQISWYAVGNVKEVCDNMFDALNEKRVFMVMGCAIWKEDFSKCTIITSTTTTHGILGHELRHCFEGHFH